VSALWPSRTSRIMLSFDSSFYQFYKRSSIKIKASSCGTESFLIRVMLSRSSSLYLLFVIGKKFD
jgi:hypothetical protein